MGPAQNVENQCFPLQIFRGLLPRLINGLTGPYGYSLCWRGHA